MAKARMGLRGLLPREKGGSSWLAIGGFVLACGWLTGCTSTPTPWENTSETTTAPAFWVAPQLTLPLPEPLCEREVMQESLLLHFTYADKDLELITLTQCSLEPRPKWTLLGLTTAGIRLFTLTWDGEQIQATQSMPPSVLRTLPRLPDPKQVLGDYALIHAPVSFWSQHLPEGFRLEERIVEKSADQTRKERVLRYKDEPALATMTFVQRSSVATNRKEVGADIIPQTFEQHRFNYTIRFERMVTDESTRE